MATQDTDQTLFWRGDFGNNYTVRNSKNAQNLSSQIELWETHPEDINEITYKIHGDVHTMNMYNRIYVPREYRFFFPKLNKGGRLVSHNYNLKFSDGGDTPGVKQAFDDYFIDRKHLVIEIAETQCLVIKD